MKLNKAIETLDTYEKGEEAVETEDLHTATKLGIEALKQIRQIRAYAKALFLPLLPGETK